MITSGSKCRPRNYCSMLFCSLTFDPRLYKDHCTGPPPETSAPDPAGLCPNSRTEHSSCPDIFLAGHNNRVRVAKVRKAASRTFTVASVEVSQRGWGRPS